MRIDILERKLHIRDGYNIQNVSANAHNCDILIKKNGYCNMPFNNPDDDPSDPCDIPMGKNL